MIDWRQAWFRRDVICQKVFLHIGAADDGIEMVKEEKV